MLIQYSWIRSKFPSEFPKFWQRGVFCREFNREFNSIDETNPKNETVILSDFDEKRGPQNVVKINVEIDENGNLKITDFKKRK